MTKPAIGAYGVLQDARTLQISRHLPGTAERVWAYLTDSELRRSWLAAGTMQPQADTAFELVWRNDELSLSPDERPEGFSEEGRATCRVIEYQPFKRLSFSWPGVGEVCFDLLEQAGGVLLTVTHHGLPDRAMILMVSAGLHMHLDIMVARVAGTPAGSFWSGWKQLKTEYEQRLSVDA